MQGPKSFWGVGRGLAEVKASVATCHQMIVCCTDDAAAILKMDMDKAYEYLKILPSLVKLSYIHTHVHRPCSHSPSTHTRVHNKTNIMSTSRSRQMI